MKLGVAALILFSLATGCFADNFTPVLKYRIAQVGCASQCQNLFSLCLQVCGGNCLSFAVTRPAVSRNCDLERDVCLRSCRPGN